MIIGAKVGKLTFEEGKTFNSCEIQQRDIHHSPQKTERRTLNQFVHHQKFNRMKANMGSTDKILRIIVAIVFGVVYFTGTVTGTLGIILLVLGGVFVATSFISFCPLYLPFGINTRGKSEK